MATNSDLADPPPPDADASPARGNLPGAERPLTFSVALKSLWKLTGPGFWPGVIFMGYAGYTLAHRALTLDVAGLFGLGAMGPLALGGTLMLNDYFDRALDAENPRKRGSPLLAGEFAPVNALHGAVALHLMALGVAFAISRPFALVVGAALLLSVLYSVPPARFKRIPGVDLLTNVTGFGILAPWAGWALGGGSLGAFPFYYWLVSAPGVAAAYMVTTLADREADEKTGVNSITVAIGPRASLALGTAALSVAAGAVVLDGLTSHWSGNPPRLFAWPFVQKVWPVAVGPVFLYVWFVRALNPRNFWFSNAVMALVVLIPNVLFLLWYAGWWVLPP